MSDIALFWQAEKMRGDLGFVNNDLALANPLENALLVSLFSDRIAPDQVNEAGRQAGITPPGTAASSALSPRRGWWGDALEEQPIGSRLWQCERLVRVDQNSVLLEVRAILHEALDWLVEDGLAASLDITVAWDPRISGRINFNIIVTEPGADAPRQFSFGWAWQGLGQPERIS